MPSRLDTPVLTVDAALIHKVDTRNVENLFSMWTGEHLRRASGPRVGTSSELTNAFSLLQVRRIIRGRSEAREPELEVMESGDLLL